MLLMRREKQALIKLVLVCVGSLIELPSDGDTARAQDMLWTDKPVRIKPQEQTFERLPAATSPELPLPKSAIQIARDVKVIDAANFRSNGLSYRIVGLRGLSPNQICRDVQGRRWACGARSRATLRSMLRERFRTQCYVEDAGPDAVLVRCLYSGNPLQDVLISRELAVPSSE